MKNKLVLLFVVALFFIDFQSCKDKSVEKTCVEIKIANEKDNCLLSVYTYNYNGSVVYLFKNSGCSGLPAQLYDVNCQYICSPHGGFTGLGDGNCLGFDSTATNRTLFWSK